MTAETDDKKTNWFVRILIILLSFFIGGLIYFNFVWTSPPAQISGGLIVLVAFLTVLILSEAFDSFSIAKLISLSRTVKEKENKNQELKKDNTELRNLMFSISANISQKQVNSTVVLTDELAKMFTVKQGEPEKQADEPPDERKRFVPFSKFREFAFPKFLHAEGLHQFPLVRNAKFVSYFQQVDPISEYSPVFDGYIKTIDTEIFIEMRPKTKITAIPLHERLYLRLSKINYYRTIKKVNAYLFLVFVIRPGDEPNDVMIDQIRQEFEPSITNGLLQIRTVEITQQENDAVIATERGDQGQT